MKEQREAFLYFFSEAVAIDSMPSGKFKISGSLIHPTKTYHKRDIFTVRKYLREYLEKATPTLIGKPIIENHDLEHVPPYMAGCQFTMAKWNNEKLSVDYEGEITAEVARRIKEGKYHGISACMNWQREGGGLLWVDGVAPFNFEFVEGSLLSDPRLKSGDDKAYFKLMEAVDLWIRHNDMDAEISEASETRIDLNNVRLTIHANLAPIIAKLRGTDDEKKSLLEMLTGQIEAKLADDEKRRRDPELLAFIKETAIASLESKYPVLKASRLVGEIRAEKKKLGQLAESIQIPDAFVTARWNRPAKELAEASRKLVAEMATVKAGKITMRPLPMQLAEAKAAVHDFREKIDSVAPDDFILKDWNQAERDFALGLRESAARGGEER